MYAKLTIKSFSSCVSVWKRSFSLDLSLKRFWWYTSGYWCGWWHCYLGWRIGFWPWAITIGLGHMAAPRYCITWVGPFSYWHMHWQDEKEFSTGWSGNWENLSTGEEEEVAGRSSD